MTLTTHRPSFAQVYIQMARMLSQRSTCVRLQVGAVITSLDHRYVFGLGYNGNASGLGNVCDRTGPDAVGNCGCLHAEENAVINCVVPRSEPKLAYVTHLPCVMCAKRLINLGGVQRVVYEQDYRIRDSVELLTRAGIQVVGIHDLVPAPG